MTVIATNTGALRAANASMKANAALSTAMERLSTGKRINSAKDDAAGLAISSSMTAQVRGMNQGIRNANDGISMAQTAEGALDEVGNMLQRMRELTVQRQNGTYSTDDQANIDKERVALAKQITSVIKNTEFNGTKLFDGSGGTDGAITIQAGATDDDQIALQLGDLTDVTAAVTTQGSEAPAGAGFALSKIVDVTKTDDTALVSAGTLEQYDTAIASIATTRAGLGAAQNRLESAVNNLTSNATNLSDAKSRIEDADFSAESTALAKAQILSQASTAMLAQANQSQQGVLKLLQ